MGAVIKAKSAPMNTDIETWKDRVFYDDITGHMQPIYRRNISLLFHVSRGQAEQERGTNVIITLIMALINVPACQKDKNANTSIGLQLLPCAEKSQQQPKMKTSARPPTESLSLF